MTESFSFSKTRQIDNFWHFWLTLATLNVNVARFAHNVEWDFFCDFQTPWPGLAFCDRRNAMLKGLIPIKNQLGKNESPFIFNLNLLQKSVDGIWGRIWFVDPDLGLAITASRCNARIGFRVSYKVCQIHKRVNELGHFSWCEKHSFLLWERKEAKTQFTAAPVLPPSHTHKL